jgi:site-specific DNA-methyltransferase (adenine-specific)
MRRLVRASLPLGRGVILDPFMGAGSTIAAAKHLGLQSVGVENDYKYFRMARAAIPKLAEFEGPQR